MVARKIYIEIYWSDDNPQISGLLQETAIFISALFRYYLPKIKTKSTKKINIELLGHPPSYEIYPIENVMNADIIGIKTIFDFNQFDKLELNAKKEILLKTIYEQLKIVFERLRVNTDVLKDTYNRVLAKNFTAYIKLCGHEKLNRSRTIKAATILEYFIGYDLLSVVFFDKNERLLRKVELFKVVPNCFMYLVKFDKWFDNEIFQVYDPSKRINFYVNINGTVTLSYNAIDKEEENRLKETVEMCIID